MSGVPPILVPLYTLGVITLVGCALSACLSAIQIFRRKSFPVRSGVVLWLSLALATAGGLFLIVELGGWTAAYQSANPYEFAAYQFRATNYLAFPWPAILILLLIPRLRHPWFALVIVLASNLVTLHTLLVEHTLF